MWAEGPGGGHHDNIAGDYAEVGCGFYVDGTSVTMVQKWLEEYGRFKPKRDVVEVVMKSEQDKIAALE